MTSPTATPTLTLASQNPWYLLATLYGEPQWEDDELQAKNREVWNRYYSSRWTDKQRESLMPLDDTELTVIRQRFWKRAGTDTIKMPDAGNGIDFRGCQFNENVFWKGYFFTSADFSNAKFVGNADFRFAKFFGHADFRDTSFIGEANFSATDFSWHASFRGATFLGDANFNCADFSMFNDFISVTFSKDAVFTLTTFSMSADFRSATFTGSALFSGATFRRVARFTNSELKAPTDFKGSRFLGEPPRFHGAKLHEDTVWRGATWPTDPWDRDEAGRFTDAYERLKQEMDRLKKHEDELMFFAKELQCRRAAAGWFKGLPIAAYGWVCDYGRSYLKPLVWMAGLFDAGVPALYFLQPDLGWGTAVGLSAVNCLAGLGIRKDLMGKVLDTLGPGALVVSGVQTILGLILLFLIGLGLRNRFRMK